MTKLMITILKISGLFDINIKAWNLYAGLFLFIITAIVVDNVGSFILTNMKISK